MKSCLECSKEIFDTNRKRCPKCAYDHHKSETARLRRIATEQNLWGVRRCTWCAVEFKPVFRSTPGAIPSRCPSCVTLTTHKPDHPCERCQTPVPARNKYCDECRRINHSERASKYRVPKPTHTCLGCQKQISMHHETCGPCGKRSRRKAVSRLRNFRDRLFTTLVHGELDTDFILKLLDSPCMYCGSTEKITIEHKTPLIRGGTHCVENVGPACWTCNSRKQSMTEEEFLNSGMLL